MTWNDVAIFVIFTTIGMFIALSMTSVYYRGASLRECVLAQNGKAIDIASRNGSSDKISRMISIQNNTQNFQVNSTKTVPNNILNRNNFKETRCRPKKKRILFVNETHTKTGLVSLPGSGNTWVRHLLEQLTGIYTGSIYNSHVIMATFKGENTTENVIAVKTHEPYQKSRKRDFERLILVIRDPFETTLSEFNRKTTGSKTNITSKDDFDYRGFQKLLRQWTARWQKFYTDYLTSFPGPIFVLFYDKLKTDLINSLSKLATFLKVDATKNDLWCIYQHKEGSYHRPPKPSWMSRSNYVFGDLENEIDSRLNKIIQICDADKNKGRIVTNL